MPRNDRPRNFDPDFEPSRDILDFKPDIRFIQPEQIIDDPPEEVEETTLDDTADETDQLIEGYIQVEKLAEEAQLRIDQIVGNLVINLDDNLDANVIEALRRFKQTSVQPDQNDLDLDTLDKFKQNQIDYNTYKQCLEEVNNASAQNIRPVPLDEITKASLEPFRSTFGGLDKAAGLKRPELEETNKSIEPINLKDFKRDMILKLFNLMKPLITELAFGIAKKLLKPF